MLHIRLVISFTDFWSSTHFRSDLQCQSNLLHTSCRHLSQLVLYRFRHTSFYPPPHANYPSFRYRRTLQAEMKQMLRMLGISFWDANLNTCLHSTKNYVATATHSFFCYSFMIAFITSMAVIPLMAHSSEYTNTQRHPRHNHIRW